MAGCSQNSSLKASVGAQNWVCRMRFICNYALGPRHTVNKTEITPQISPVVFEHFVMFSQYMYIQRKSWLRPLAAMFFNRSNLF